MSIWNHMNDIERQTLRDAKQTIADAEVDLAKIKAASIDADNTLAKAKRDVKDYQAQAVTRALGGSALPAPEPPASIADLEFLIVGLADRQTAVEHELNVAKSHYETESRRVLSACLERAADVYREQADALVESWHELNEGQTALGPRDLSWMHIFIPAIEGMKGSQPHHSLSALFSGKDYPLIDSGAVMSELDGLLS